MSEVAHVAAEVVAFTSSDLETLRNVLAPGIPEPDLKLYAKVCENLGLSPFRGEIVAVARRTRDPNSSAANPRWLTVWRHQITVVGRRVMAERTGEVEGIVGPEWCGPHRPEPDSPLMWEDVWLRDGPPHAARVTVYRRGRKPYVGTVPWREFYVRDSQENPTGLWATMPAHMLGKVAENLALGRAFPEILHAARAAGIEWEDAPRDEAAESGSVEPESGSEVGRGSRGPSPRRTRDPSEFLARDLIRPDQVKRIQALFEAVGLAGEKFESARHSIVAEAIGREFESAVELSPSEGGAIIGHLELMRAEEDARRLSDEGLGDEAGS